MIYLLMCISFLLDGFISTLISPNSVLFPLFSLVILIIIYPFFNKDNRNYFFISCALVGFFYDAVYTNTFLLNLGLFLLLGIIISLVFRFFSSNLVSTIFTGIFVIFIYRIITYLILVISGYLRFSFMSLIKGIYSSLIINIVYIIIIYLITKLISNKLKLRRFS